MDCMCKESEGNSKPDFVIQRNRLEAAGTFFFNLFESVADTCFQYWEANENPFQNTILHCDDAQSHGVIRAGRESLVLYP